MDWDKAKRNIILMLIGMNILLLFSILAHNNNVSIDNPYFSGDAQKDFENILQERNITIETTLPRTIYNVGVMNVEYQDIHAENYPELFRDFVDILVLENNKKIELNITKDQLPKSLSKNYRFEDSKGRGEFAQDFLQQYFSKNQFQLKFENQDSLLIYNPIFDGRIYEDSYVEFAFNKDNVVISAVLIMPFTDSFHTRKSTTSVEGVLNALPQLVSGDKIIAVDFIYYFDLTGEELHRVKNARAFPHWRIITESSKVVYVPAFEQ